MMSVKRLRARADGLAPHLVTIPVIADEHGVDPVTVAIWANKYDDFPAPVYQSPSGVVRVYLREELDAWIAKRRSQSPTFGSRRVPLDWKEVATDVAE